MRELRRVPDVGLGTVFLYAANKRDLLFLIANDGLEEANAAWEIAVKPTAPLLENLIAVFAQPIRVLRPAAGIIAAGAPRNGILRNRRAGARLPEDQGSA